MPFDVETIRPDVLVSATYKWLLGPYSMGFAWLAPRWRQGTPLEQNWIGRAHSENFAGLIDYQTTYQPGARRFDVGERSNFALMPMTVAALLQLLEWGVANIADTLAIKTATIASRAAALGFGSAPTALRAANYLGLTTDRLLPADLPQRLAERNVFVSVRGRAVRVTPHLYTTETDIDRFIDALSAFVA